MDARPLNCPPQPVRAYLGTTEFSVTVLVSIHQRTKSWRRPPGEGARPQRHEAEEKGDDELVDKLEQESASSHYATHTLPGKVNGGESAPRAGRLPKPHAPSTSCLNSRTTPARLCEPRASPPARSQVLQAIRVRRERGARAVA